MNHAPSVALKDLTAASPAREAWWGRYTLEESTAGCWRIGPCKLLIQRLQREWRVSHWYSKDPFDSTVELTIPVLTPSEPADAVVNRFSIRKTSQVLTITPALADRAMVVRPEAPLYIMGGEESILYINTAVWIRVQTGEPAKQLHELPSFRPSDTWFGSSTLEGELCYASRTTGRLHLEELPFRPHRAVTPIRIVNRAKDALLVERIKLPIQYLSLYQTPDHALWTPAVTLTRESSGEFASLQISKGAPAEARKAERVSEPRQKAEKNLVLRAFSALFNTSRGPE